MSSTSQADSLGSGINILSMPNELKLEVMEYLDPEDRVHLKFSCRDFYHLHWSSTWVKLGECLLSCSKCKTQHTKDCFTPAMQGKDAKKRICKARGKWFNVLPDVWLHFNSLQDLIKNFPLNGGRAVGMTEYTVNSQKGQSPLKLRFPARYKADSNGCNVKAWMESAICLDQSGRVSVETQVSLAVFELHVSRYQASNTSTYRLDKLLEHWDLSLCPHKNLWDYRSRVIEMVKADVGSHSHTSWQTQHSECEKCFAKVTVKAKCCRKGNDSTQKEESLGRLEVKVVRQLGNRSDIPQRELFRQLSDKCQTTYSKGWWEGEFLEAE